MRNLINRVVEVLKPGNVLPVASIESEIVISTPEIRKPCRETDDEPFFQIERLKENLFRHRERFFERFEDLNSIRRAVHIMI